MAREGGIEFVFPDFMPNTHSALALGEFGRDRGPDVHESVHEAVFTAYNGRAEDIGDAGVLARIAGETGLDVAAAMAAIEEGRYDERLHQFGHLAVGMGISATPAALICNELFIGTRPYQVLSDAVSRCMIAAADFERDEAPEGLADGA
jgi:predicted DsbA family dithiol-disulfide isomerase